LKILHVALSNFYLDGMTYQENELVRCHVEAGHEVRVLASTETLGPDKKLTYCEPSEYVGTDGAKVTRIRYRPLIPGKLARKLRIHPGVRAFLEDFGPDVIIFHSLCGWELTTVSRYARDHPEVEFHVDSHEDHNNSARNWISRRLLHGLYYRTIIRSSLSPTQPILCISTETQDFVERVYGIDRKRLMFFPLGGRILGDIEYNRRRTTKREYLRLNPNQLLIVQAGKMGIRKKLLENLRAFSSVPGLDSRLVLAGTLADEIQIEARDLIDADDRISFDGWAESDELLDLLCAADLYVQPGTQSATMQLALCARCAVALDDVPSHDPYMNNNGWLLNDSVRLESVYWEMNASPTKLLSMAARSLAIAQKMLDYDQLARDLLPAFQEVESSR